jgi:hypothetical protein
VRIQQGKASLEEDERTVVTAPEDGDGVELRWLRPGVNRFIRGPRGDLQLEISGRKLYRGVFSLRCFPVQHADRYISIRVVGSDDRVMEAGIVRDLSEWPPEARRLIAESLSRRYFFHTVRRIHGVSRNLQFLTFQAATDQGNVEFMIRQDPESAQNYGAKGKLLVDVEDNLYLIPDLEGLGRSDREIFNRYVFW